jgi:hypothetical protein
VKRDIGCLSANIHYKRKHQKGKENVMIVVSAGDPRGVKMGNRRNLNITGLVLIVLALLVGTYKLAEYRTEEAHRVEKVSYQEESYRQGYTYGYVEGHTNGYVKGVETDGKSKVECETDYEQKTVDVYADIHCYRTINGKQYHSGWFWFNESYVGPGPDGVPATSGPNAK